jgi:hypothetical protein
LWSKIVADNRLRQLFAITAAAPLVSLPLVMWYFPTSDSIELSWLQIGSAALLSLAVVLAILEQVLPKVGWLFHFSLPRIVTFLALSALAVVMLWSVVKGD